MEYTEKENKAIEDLRKTINYYNKRFEENEKITAVLVDNFDVENLFVLLNLIVKQQKEIEENNKKINSLQTIITKDLPTNQQYINTFFGIPIEEAIVIVESYKNTKIHLSDEEYRKNKLIDIAEYIEYYLIGNSRYKDSQEKFEYLLKRLKDLIGE